MAIIRLVNGITDAGQKRKVASSVAAVANDAGQNFVTIKAKIKSRMT